MAGIDIISDSTGKEIVAAIQSTDVAQARILEINTAAEAKKNEVLESIPEDYSNISKEVDELKGDLDNLESGTLNLSWYTTFTNGGLDGIRPYLEQPYRIYSINPIILDRDIELSVGDFYVFLRVYMDGVYTPDENIDIQPNTVTTLTKGTQFKCVIRRYIEDKSEVADIQEFLAGATFKSNIEKRLEASEESNSEIYRIKSLMIDVNNGNIRLDYFSPFANGGLSGVTLYPPQKCRIYSVNPITFEKDTKISIIKDFYVFLRFYNNGVYDETLDVTVNPYSQYTIPGGVPFKCVIRRYIEDTSEVADIQEFLDSVAFNSIQHDIDILKENEWKRTNNIVKFFAHQGYSTTSQYYGNSRISSYKGAFLNGFDAGETDVQWTSDEIAVCCHDATFVDTITNETIIIADHTLEELKTYSYYGEKIATLEEIVSICKVLGLKLEIDHLDINWSEDKWNKLFDIVKKYQMQNDVVWSIGVELFNKIMDFDKNSSVVIDASDSVNMQNTIAFVNKNITDYNHIYISFLYTKMPVELIKECSGQLPSRSGLWVWSPDTIENVLACLPYVKMVTSNKISYSKIIGQIIN